MPRALAFSLLLISASAWSATAAAQDAPSQLDEAARLTFESAREDFEAGRYEQALARFRQAYQLSPRPGLLYNIAQTLDRLRRDEETVQALRDYLAADPNAQNRAEVEARIRVLDEALASRASAEPPPTETTSEPTPEQTSSQGIGVLHPAIFIGVGAAALGSAGVLVWAGLDTLALNDAYLATTREQDAVRAYNDANDRQLLTNVFIGVTAALGVAAAALAVFTDWNAFSGGSEGSAQLAPVFAASDDGVWLGLGGSF